VAQKIGQADAKKLIAMGIFPYGINEKTKKPYLNACGGKKRDESMGFFEKGDWCSKVGCKHHKDTPGARAFARRYPKAEHYKATCVGGTSEGKVRDLGAGTSGVSLAKVSPKRKAKFSKYLQVALEISSGGCDRPFAFEKSKEKVAEWCKGPLGKVKVNILTIPKPITQFSFKIDGVEITNDSGIEAKVMTAREFFIGFYRQSGKVLYEQEEEEEDDTDDEDDMFADEQLALGGDDTTTDEDEEEAPTEAPKTFNDVCAQAQAEQKKGKGRPKGSKNKAKDNGAQAE